MDNAAESVEIQRPKQEIKQVPRVRQLARANTLALYWDKPLSSLTSEGHALPGISERFLPEDRTQTLGSFLSDGDPQLQTFDAFKQELASDNKDKIRKVLSGFKTICPSPEELFRENPHLLNWVPWETFIAYGDVLQTQREIDDEAVASVISGREFLEKMRERFPKGHPTKRTEIVLERQNKDPKSQGVLEAVSNSIDAISDREKIGQFGLGVKQVFTWLESGNGNAQVITKTANGEILSLHAQKGYDDQIYIKFAPPTQEEQEQFADGRTGTVLKVSGVAIDSSTQADLNKKLHDRFQYVPETRINVNGTAINGHERVKVVGRTTPITSQGQIDIEIDDNGIAISDTGSGMDQQTLFTMFLPGYGKGYNPISAHEARELAEHQAEVLLVETDTPRIVFARNREADFAIDIPKDRLNTSHKSICIELGRILKVSEGRDGFEIDDNFAVAVPILVEKTLHDATLTDAEKTAFLNSLTLGIDQLSGRASSGAEDKLAAIVRKTKKGIRTSALPYLQQLQSSNTRLLPNYSTYQKVAGDAQFVDPYLLEGMGDIATLLQTEGITRLKGKEGVITKGGWKVFTTDLTESEGAEEFATQLQSKEKLAGVRAKLAEVLPVVVDKQHHIVIVDQAIWQKIEAEQDPIRKAYLQESVQAILNEKVLTSYEATDPRSIFVQDAEKSETSVTEGEIVISKDEEKKLYRYRQAIWNQDNVLCSLDSSGVVKRYDEATKEFLDNIVIPEMAGKEPLLAQPTDQGVWLLQKGGELVLLDSTGTIRENYHLPQITGDDYSNLWDKNDVTISSNGRVIFSRGARVHIIDPRTQQSDIYESGSQAEINSSYLTADNKLVFMQDGKITVADRSTGSVTVSSGNDFSVQNKNYYLDRRFFTHKDKLYAVAFTISAGEMGIFEITQNNQEVTARPVLDSLDLGFDLSSFGIATSPDSDVIGIQTSRRVTYLESSTTDLALKESVRFPESRSIADMAYVASALKDLFGDDRDTSYGEAIVSLRERLRGEKLTIDNRMRTRYRGEEKIMRNRRSEIDIPALVEESRPFIERIEKYDRILKRPIEPDIHDILFPKGEIFPEPRPRRKLDLSGLATYQQPPEKPSNKTVITTPLTNERIQQFIGVLSSDQVRNVFAPIWEEIKESGNVEDQERLKMRFVRNSALLLDLPTQNFTPELMQMFFLSDNPQIFFDQSETHQQRLVNMLSGIDGLSQKEGLTKLVTLLTRQRTPEELNTFYTQLDKLFSREQLKEAFLQAITQNADELPIAATAPTELAITNPLRSYLLFITDEADILRTKEQLVSEDGYEDVLPHQIPLELLAYFRLTDGLLTTDEISSRIAEEGSIEAVMEKINLSHYQDEIRKAVHAQSVEPGVAKRELLQNALYAIRRKGKERGRGAVTVDFYLRDNGEEYVEEIKDTGTGIENLVSFLVPGVTTKEATEGLGIFGTGLYKAFEDVDHVEVDTIKKGSTHNQAERIIIDLIKDDEGQVQGGVVREIKAKEVSSLTETGTTLRLVRRTEDHLPELEAMVAKNTYLSMGGLAANPHIADLDVQFSFVDDAGNEQPVTVPIDDRSVLSLENVGNLTFVKAPSLPSAMTSLGLRMSPLANTSSDYLSDVPDVLKDFLTNEHISLILPKEIPLVKDRSRIANEEQYLPEIQQAIATETIKRTAYALLNDIAVNVRGLIPEDILTNQNYYRTLTSESGSRAYAIAQRINNGIVLNHEDLSFLNNDSTTNDLLLVLIGIEQAAPDGRRDSLLRRFQYIQEKAGNTTTSTAISTSLGFDVTETAVTQQLVREEERLVPQAQATTQANAQIAAVDTALNERRKPQGVTSLAETPMDQSEKDLLMNYFSGLGFEEVYFVPHEQLGAEGSCNGRRLFLNAELLQASPRERWGVIDHESAHLLEKRAIGIADGVFDTDANKRSNFTHQQEGPFAEYYRIAAELMQRQLAA